MDPALDLVGAGPAARPAGARLRRVGVADRVEAAVVERVVRQPALACSFQKEETVLLDLLFGLEPKARVFAIDTHHLFPETYAYWRDVEQRYGTAIEVFEGPSPAELAAAHGEALWDRNPDLYLSIAKIAPLVSALGGLDAWITGVRRDQAPTKSSQAWFVKHFGPNVNLGNIPPEEVIPLETLRLGLRGDTLKEVLGYQPVHVS